MFFYYKRSDLMLMWLLHELMASILFLLLLLSLYTISCFKSESSPRGRLYFSSFVFSLSLSEREGGSNSHEGDRDRGVGCWQSAKAKKCCTVLTTDIKTMPPTSPALSCFICKAERVPSSQRFPFGHLAVLNVSPVRDREVKNFIM